MASSSTTASQLDPPSQTASQLTHASSTSSSSSLTATTNQSSKKSNETTLTHLTKRFVKLLNSSTERVINLNEASSRLSVAKRRIYDITNVLEGIGLLQKTSKNVTRWIDCPRDSPFAAQQTTATSAAPAATNIASDATDLDKLAKTYKLLEEGVNHLKAEIRQQLSGEGAYVTYQDIKSFFNDQIVIAVKAPPETRLEVNESLQIWLKSENGEIEVYLCPQYASSSTNNISSDGERETVSTDDPILSSANTVGEEDPFEPLVPYAREDTHYNFMLDDDYSITSLFPDDNLGLY